MTRTHARARLLTLTAALLAHSATRRGDGEPDPTKKTRAEWEAERQAELNKLGISELASKVATLEYDLRETRRKVPKDGARVLTPEEATEYDALAALGKSGELKGRLEKGDAAQTTLAGRERSDHLRDVAEAGGLNLKALTRLAGELQFEVGAETEVDGKKVRPVTVKDGDKSKALAEYLKDEWADVAPALQTQALGITTTTQFTPQDAGAGSGTGTGNTGGQSWMKQHLAAQQKDAGYVDPLRPAPAATPPTGGTR